MLAAECWLSKTIHASGLGRREHMTAANFIVFCSPLSIMHLMGQAVRPCPKSQMIRPENIVSLPISSFQDNFFVLLATSRRFVVPCIRYSVSQFTLFEYLSKARRVRLAQLCRDLKHRSTKPNDFVR